MKNVFTKQEMMGHRIKEDYFIIFAKQGSHNDLFKFWREKREVFIQRTKDYAIGE